MPDWEKHKDSNNLACGVEQHTHEISNCQGVKIDVEEIDIQEIIAELNQIRVHHGNYAVRSHKPVGNSTITPGMMLFVNA